MIAFLKDDSGAVTVDWVVLTAAVVGLGIATVGAVRSGVGTLGTNISSSLTSASVASLGTLGSGSGVQAVVPDDVPVSLPEPMPGAGPVPLGPQPAPSGPLPPPDL